MKLTSHYNLTITPSVVNLSQEPAIFSRSELSSMHYEDFIKRETHCHIKSHLSCCNLWLQCKFKRTKQNKQTNKNKNKQKIQFFLNNPLQHLCPFLLLIVSDTFIIWSCTAIPVTIIHFPDLKGINHNIHHHNIKF